MSRQFPVVAWVCILVACILLWLFVGHLIGWESIVIFFIVMVLLGVLYDNHKHHPRYPR